MIQALYVSLVITFGYVSAIFLPPDFKPRNVKVQTTRKTSDANCHAILPGQGDMESCWGDFNLVRGAWSGILWFHCCSVLSAEQLKELPGSVDITGPFYMTCPDDLTGDFQEDGKLSLDRGRKKTKVICRKTLPLFSVAGLKYLITCGEGGGTSDECEELLPTNIAGSSSDAVVCQDSGWVITIPDLDAHFQTSHLDQKKLP